MYESLVEVSKSVGPETVALTIAAPDEFEAEPGQFVLITAEIDGEEETGYYTISSSAVTDTFEITIGVDPDGTLGPWLATLSEGDSLQFDGPYGNIEYTGGTDVIVFASGPGIGPAVGIGERAIDEGREVAVGYVGEPIPHEDRIDSIRDEGGTIVVGDDVATIITEIETISTGRTAYVFGFERFVKEARDELDAADLGLTEVEIENFGPE